MKKTVFGRTLDVKRDAKYAARCGLVFAVCVLAISCLVAFAPVKLAIGLSIFLSVVGIASACLMLLFGWVALLTLQYESMLGNGKMESQDES